jgi:hypothetical protein
MIHSYHSTVKDYQTTKLKSKGGYIVYLIWKYGNIVGS